MSPPCARGVDNDVTGLERAVCEAKAGGSPAHDVDGIDAGTLAEVGAGVSRGVDVRQREFAILDPPIVGHVQRADNFFRQHGSELKASRGVNSSTPPPAARCHRARACSSARAASSKAA